MAITTGTVTVSAFIPGHFYLPHKEVFQDAVESNATTGDIVPTFAFLVEHPSRGKYLFDLGLRKHGKGYPPAWNETLEEFKPVCNEDVCDILRANHVDPAEVKGVIMSHLHFDHTGDIVPFTSAEIILGAEAKPLFDKPYPEDPESLFCEWPKGRSVRYLDFSTLAATTKTDAADSSSPSPCPLPAFNKAIDLFSDQSFFIIDAPGHFPGHLMALARVSASASAEYSDPTTTSDNVYVLLAADCCHNRQCYSPGTRLISQENYEDILVARETVSSLIRTAREMPNVVIVLAHERELEAEMPLLPDSLNKWAVGRTRERKESFSVDLAMATVGSVEESLKKRSRDEDGENDREDEEANRGSRKKVKVLDEETLNKSSKDQEGENDAEGEEDPESRKEKTAVSSGDVGELISKKRGILQKLDAMIENPMKRSGNGEGKSLE